jgi:2-hydroxy-6-oxonona-2,4-dienedioate hydrolase
MNTKKIYRYRESEKTFFNENHIYPIEHFIEVKELSIRIRVLEIGTGSPVLFIHGAPAAAALWIPLVRNMQGHRNLIIDRPGCGMSEKVNYQGLTRERLQIIMLLTIDSVLDYFNLRQVPIVASSFGASLSFLYVFGRSNRVSKLVIEGCPALINGSHVPSFMKPMLLPVMKWIIPRLPATASIFNKIITGLGHSYSLEHQLIDQTFIQWYISLFNNTDTQKNEIAMITKAYPSGKIKSCFQIQDEELEKIEQPALLLWSSDDPFGNSQTAQHLKSKIKHSTLILFENSGHLPWLDDPAVHAGEIKKFI